MPNDSDRTLVTTLLAALAQGPITMSGGPTLDAEGSAASWCPAERVLYVDPTAPSDEQDTAFTHVLMHMRRAPLQSFPWGTE